MEKFQKQAFKLDAIQHSMMKSHTLSLHPTQETNHPLAQHIHALSDLAALQSSLLLSDRLLRYCSACVQVTLTESAHHKANIIHLISFHHNGITSSHIITRKGVTIT